MQKFELIKTVQRWAHAVINFQVEHLVNESLNFTMVPVEHLVNESLNFTMAKFGIGSGVRAAKGQCQSLRTGLRRPVDESDAEGQCRGLRSVSPRLIGQIWRSKGPN